jgi:hypothetical protein
MLYITVVDLGVSVLVSYRLAGLVNNARMSYLLQMIAVSRSYSGHYNVAAIKAYGWLN